MKIQSKKLLYIDYFGAVVSSFMLGIVLTYIQPLIGMPKVILYQLAIVALCLMSFSGLSILLVKTDYRFSLITIGLANFCYCIASLWLINVYFEELTILGLSYFIIEKLIVLTLAYLEIKKALK